MSWNQVVISCNSCNISIKLTITYIENLIVDNRRSKFLDLSVWIDSISPEINTFSYDGQ